VFRCPVPPRSGRAADPLVLMLRLVSRRDPSPPAGAGRRPVPVRTCFGRGSPPGSPEWDRKARVSRRPGLGFVLPAGPRLPRASAEYRVADPLGIRKRQEPRASALAFAKLSCSTAVRAPSNGGGRRVTRPDRHWRRNTPFAPLPPLEAGGDANSIDDARRITPLVARAIFFWRPPLGREWARPGGERTRVAGLLPRPSRNR